MAQLKQEETRHNLYVGDARNLDMIKDQTVGLVLTSPPYWNIKEYKPNEAQLGHIDSYDDFIKEINLVWKECFRVLISGGRLIVVVGDVLMSRKQAGRHYVVPLHSDIQIECRKLGFDNLSPIIWNKIGNSSYEMGPGGVLGKPFEPNGIIKNNIEYILMLRKPGGYRSPSEEQRQKSKLSKEEFNLWFRQVWTDVPGANLKAHPAAFPEELAYRLVRMFSFHGDLVADPFSGSGTTSIAALRAGRDSVGVDIDESYTDIAVKRLKSKGCDEGVILAKQGNKTPHASFVHKKQSLAFVVAKKAPEEDVAQEENESEDEDPTYQEPTPRKRRRANQ